MRFEKSAFLGIAPNGDGTNIAVCAAGTAKLFQVTGPAEKNVSEWINTYERKNKIKIVAAGIHPALWDSLYSPLWLKNDVSPLPARSSASPLKASLMAASHFDEHAGCIAEVDNQLKVTSHPLVTLEEYRKITPPKAFNNLLLLKEKFRGRKAIFISSTPQGGGVAIMRHGLTRMSKLLGINMEWYVLKESPEVFLVTKQKFHNVLQDISSDTLKATDIKKYQDWIQDNAEILKKPIKSANFVVVDDPQPSGLIPYIKAFNPKAKIIYRSHIMLHAKLAEKPKTPQNITWEYLWQFVKMADTFVSHPIKDFVPSRIPKNKVVYMPAATDPLDGLNKELGDFHKEYYRGVLERALANASQPPLNTQRFMINQIARFDPSKGIPDVLEVFRTVRNKSRRPAIMIAGNSSVDDPDGAVVYRDLLKRIQRPEFAHIRKDIYAVRLPHRDQLLNYIIRRGAITLQLSHKEGYEIKVSESLMKGIPVIAYKSGGIKLQIRNNIDGYLLSTGDTNSVSRSILKLMKDTGTYQKMHVNALTRDYTKVSVIGNTINWLSLFEKLSSKQSV